MCDPVVAGPKGEEYCWWQCTVKGGREGRDIDAITLAQGVEALGAGEIMLNCIDRDGTNSVSAPGQPALA
jgi:imidazole glycerol-phosphate synthase